MTRAWKLLGCIRGKNKTKVRLALFLMKSHPHHYSSVHVHVLLLMMALGLSFLIVAAVSCEFFQYTGRADNRSGKAGLFSIQDSETGECVNYRLSGTASLAQLVVVGAWACAIIAIIFGAIALFLVLLEFCCCMIPCSRVILESLTYLVAWVCQGLTFLVWANQTYWYTHNIILCF